MIGYEQYARIAALSERGLTPAQVAADCGLDARTVRLWLKRGAYRARKQRRRESLLDPHRATVARLLAEHPLSARQVMRRLLEEGYAGGYGIVKALVRELRPPRGRAFLPLAFGPGECAQADWGSAGTLLVDGARRRLSFFAMVLCHSRMLYVEFTLGERQEQFLECHRNAFRFFGGVPRRVMLDNLKSAVLSHPRGLPAEYNPRYLDFAAHHGFEPRACQPRRANEKGRVENAVGYVRKSFLAGLEPAASLAAMQAAARTWLDGVANVRVHAATRRRPVDMLAEEGLLPLPAAPYDTGVERDAVATALFRVHFDGNRYSVPARHAGTRVRVRAYAERVSVYAGDKLVASHPRSYGRGLDVADPDHGGELLRQRRRARDQHVLARFLALCPGAADFQARLAERRANPSGHVRRIVAHAEVYGPEETARALRDAAELGAYSAECVANILEQRARPRAEPGALHVTRRADLLELELPAPDLSAYGRGDAL
jgi:transposase